eukprot:1151180-Pelagomonas_calceolata.AAC.7
MGHWWCSGWGRGVWAAGAARLLLGDHPMLQGLDDQIVARALLLLTWSVMMRLTGTGGKGP